MFGTIRYPIFVCKSRKPENRLKKFEIQELKLKKSEIRVGKFRDPVLKVRNPSRKESKIRFVGSWTFQTQISHRTYTLPLYLDIK